MIPESRKVIRRGEIAMPFGSVISRVAFENVHQIQQRLTLAHQHDVDTVDNSLRPLSGPRKHLPTISPALRLRSSEERRQQNLQSTAPTCVEMQNVDRSPSGIQTDSTVFPSARRSR